jgi:hypothetical protein
MTIKEKNENCVAFFDALCDMLADSYERYASCNQDISAYLCPIGTTDEVTYYGKPEGSFRVSNHWNWYANTNKCSNPKQIQCYCTGLPWAHRRAAPDKAGKPIMASCVCIYRFGRYHVVYGEYFDRKTKTWKWIDRTPEEVITMFV